MGSEVCVCAVAANPSQAERTFVDQRSMELVAEFEAELKAQMREVRTVLSLRFMRSTLLWFVCVALVRPSQT
jgi:hypothetical protein